jgi:hypothetical protein
MIRYVGPFVAVSLLTLTGCLTYPYGNYLGYGGYGGYPYNDYPYDYGASYCPPSYGYSYDSYASSYGYGCGYSPGVVIPVPAPPVVVEDHVYSYGNPRYTSGRRWQRQHAREGYSNHFPDNVDPLSGGPAASPARTGDGRQAAREWVRQRNANQPTQTRNSGILPENFDPNRLLGAGSGTAGAQSPRAGAWQGGQNRQFINRNQARMPAGPNLGAATRANSGAQMRRSTLLQQRGSAAGPRMRQAPSISAAPQPMRTRSAPRLQAGQVRQAPARTGRVFREGRLRMQ